MMSLDKTLYKSNRFELRLIRKGKKNLIQSIEHGQGCLVIQNT